MKKSLILAIIILSASVKAMAHSIRIEVQENYPTITVNASFSKTSPMANAIIEVFSPENEKLFQTGRIDINGRFAFLPDTPGRWKVKINDEMGHMKNTEINVTEDFFRLMDIEEEDEEENAEMESKAKKDDLKEEIKSSEKKIPILYKTIFGLAIIFGITGIFYGFKAKKSNK